MTLYTHTIEISENTFQRLNRQAQIKQTTVNEVAEQALNRALPPSLEMVPERWRADLQQMQMMSDEMIWRIARTELSAERSELYDRLVATKTERELSASEQGQLDILHEESDMLMIRKSYAWLLLQSLSYHTPDPFLAYIGNGAITVINVSSSVSWFSTPCIIPAGARINSPALQTFSTSPTVKRPVPANT